MGKLIGTSPKPMRYSLPLAPLVCGLLAGFTVLPAMAATVVGPYFQNFEGYATGVTTTDFTENNDAGYVIATDGGDQVLRGRVASASYIAAGVNVAGSAGRDFSVTTQAKLFELNTGTGSTNLNLSLAAAGTTSNFNGSEYRFTFDFLDGDIDVSRNGVTQVFTTTGGSTGLLRTVGTSYTMSLSGVYSSPTSVLLTMSITDGTTTFTGTFQDNAALSGEHFGYRIGRNGTSTTIGTYLDDFDLNVIPEPSAVALLAGGMGLLAMRRSRR